MDELILVDIFDRETGFCSKEEAHRRGLLHRAFSVFAYSGGSMLIQQRAFGKYHSGGLWANTCCSHPRRGESLENAVRRRLREETGITGRPEEAFSFVYRHSFRPDLHEYEYDHVFLMEYDGEVTADPEEIAAVRWIPFDRLAGELLDCPEKYAPWFLTAAPRVLALMGGPDSL